MPGTRPGMTGVMSELALTIRAETPDDDAAIERLHERTFGPGRYARTAFRIREGRRHLLPVSFTARIGIKESSGGLGGDLALLNGQLTLHADLFDFNFDYYPRLKVAAAYQLFKYLYVYGGVDDVFNDHQSLEVQGTTPTGNEFRYEFGRDVFAGAMLRFTGAAHIGETVSLQLLDRGAIAGQVRWLRDGRMGVYFASPLE